MSLVVLILILIIPVTVHYIYKHRKKAGSSRNNSQNQPAEELYEEVDKLPQQQTGGAFKRMKLMERSAITQPLELTLYFD